MSVDAPPLKVDTSSLRDELTLFTDACRPPRRRTLREFAEQEIYVPDGKFEGLRFGVRRQPYFGLLFDLLDSGTWRRAYWTGCVQSGKTLVGIIVLAWLIFELRETTIFGLPDMNMAGDKWREDIKPVINRTQYRSLLPARGPGSRDGAKLEYVSFQHGPTMKFMAGGGGDAAVSAFTARNVFITEVDKMRKASSSSSPETDKITQILARTESFDDARIYGECTLTVASGRTHQEITGGTDTRIAVPCPHCDAWVTPLREHLHGWQDADSETEAYELAHFVCPSCHSAWTEAERVAANHDMKAVHKGQVIDGQGRISGDAPDTFTLGFKWNAFNNLFQTAGHYGAKEWRAARAEDEDEAERAMCQLIWAIPYEPPIIDIAPLDDDTLAARVDPDLPRGVVPPWCDYLTAHVDLHKAFARWMVMAFSAAGRGHVVDYGEMPIAHQEHGVEGGTLMVLRDFRQRADAGWLRPEETSRRLDQVWLDYGWSESEAAIVAFLKETSQKNRFGDRYRAAIGRARSQFRMQSYARPKKTGAVVRKIGEAFHISRQPTTRIDLVEVNADYWKTFVHRRLSCDRTADGAITFYQARPSEHRVLVKNLTAEHLVLEFDRKRGEVEKWERHRRNNHYFDTMYNCAAAASLCGMRIVRAANETKKTPVTDWFSKAKKRRRP